MRLVKIMKLKLQVFTSPYRPIWTFFSPVLSYSKLTGVEIFRHELAIMNN